MTPVLELEGVTKAYGALRPLRIEQFTLESGDATALVGLDGPAAEVFVNLVIGTTLPDAGRVVTFGQPTTAIIDSAAWMALTDRVGMVSERAVLLDALSVVQNIAVPLTLDIEPPKPDILERAVGLARRVGLPVSSWDTPVGALDGAGRMRVHLARALANAPELLLLEHPTARLAAEEGAALGHLVRSLVCAEGLAVLALTVDEDFAEAVATRVLRPDPRTGRVAPSGWRFWKR